MSAGHVAIQPEAADSVVTYEFDQSADRGLVQAHTFGSSTGPQRRAGATGRVGSAPQRAPRVSAWLLAGHIKSSHV